MDRKVIEQSIDKMKNEIKLLEDQLKREAYPVQTPISYHGHILFNNCCNVLEIEADGNYCITLHKTFIDCSHIFEWIPIERKDLKAYFKLDDLESYDAGYYSRKFKEEKYNLDEKELKKYFEYENVLNYLHNFVNKFLGLELKEVKVPVYHDSIKVYEVYRNGEQIAYYFLDAFYRKEKRG